MKNFGKFLVPAVASLLSVGPTAFARPAQVGDRIIISRAARMDTDENLRVPEAIFSQGKNVGEGEHSNWSCALAPEGDEFEKRFGDVHSYSRVSLAPKSFDVVGIHKDGGGHAVYLNLVASTGGSYSMICSRYTAPLEVEFSTDTDLINSSLGSYGSISNANAERILTGSVRGWVRKNLKL